MYIHTYIHNIQNYNTYIYIYVYITSFRCMHAIPWRQVGWALLNAALAVGDRLLQRLMLAQEQQPAGTPMDTSGVGDHGKTMGKWCFFMGKWWFSYGKMVVNRG